MDDRWIRDSLRSNLSYDRFVKEEFGREPKPRGISWVWWVTALILVLLFGSYFLFH